MFVGRCALWIAACCYLVMVGVNRCVLCLFAVVCLCRLPFDVDFI